MQKRFISLSACLLTSFAFSSASQAATISTDQTCYRSSGDSVKVTGSGFQPRTSISMSLNGKDLHDFSQVDGSVLSKISQPVASGSELVHTNTLTATDGVNSASTTFQSTSLAVSPAKLVGKAKARKTVSVSGFDPNTKLYAHYLRAYSSKKDVAIGVAAGPCGTLTKTLTYGPKKKATKGVWTIQIDGNSKYSNAVTDNVKVAVELK